MRYASGRNSETGANGPADVSRCRVARRHGGEPMTQRSFELPVLHPRRVDHAAAAATFTRDVPRTDWHDDALWFVREKRDRAAATVSDWEELRQRASSIKEHALSHLDEYLEQFEAQAVRNGMQVHWARDADEHNR